MWSKNTEATMRGNLFGLTRQKFVVLENNFSDEEKWMEMISSSDDFVDLNREKFHPNLLGWRTTFLTVIRSFLSNSHDDDSAHRLKRLCRLNLDGLETGQLPISVDTLCNGQENQVRIMLSSSLRTLDYTLCKVLSIRYMRSQLFSLRNSDYLSRA